MKNTKKLLAGVLCVATVAASTTAFAANSWKFQSYRTTQADIQNNVYPKMWYEVDSRGVPTGRTKTEGAATSIEWKLDFYEKDYPHAGVNRLYLDGQATTVLRDSGSYADWETKYEPEMWECKYPYRIFERIKTNIPGIGWYANTLVHRGLTSGDLLKYLGKNEPVTRTYEYFGFGPYRIVNKDLIENDEYRLKTEDSQWWYMNWNQALYNDFYRWTGATDLDGNYIVDSKYLLDNAGINVADYYFPFSGEDIVDVNGNVVAAGALSNWSNGQYVLSNNDIAQLIPVFKSEYLQGKDYVRGGLQKIDIATYFTKTKNATMFDADFIVNEPTDKAANIDWTNEMFQEWDATINSYRQYQYMIVDGVILDGRTIGYEADLTPITLPRVYREAGWALGIESVNSNRSTNDTITAADPANITQMEDTARK